VVKQKSHWWTDYFKKLSRQTTQHDAKKIAEKLISMAKNGSLNAIKLLAERTEGKPKRNAEDSQKESSVLSH
jgi:hypothetical protein